MKKVYSHLFIPFLLIISSLLVCCKPQINLEELIAINISTPSSPVCFFADTLGNVVFKTPYQECRDFEEGLCAVLDHGKWGYINTKGELVISPKYSIASPFKNGMACVANKKNHFGIINKEGEEIVPCIYYGIHQLQHGIRIVTDTNLVLGCMKEDGEILFPFKYESILMLNNGNIYLQEKKGNKFIYTTAQDTISLNYDIVRFSSLDKAWVTNHEGLQGIIDMNGEEIVPCKYKYIYDYKDNWATFRKDDGRMGWVKNGGKEIFFPLSQRHTYYREGMVKVYDNQWNYGYYNENGELAIPYIYESANDFSEGLACVRKRGEQSFGFINKKGEMVIPARYVFHSQFNNGVAQVRYSVGDYFYIDTLGNKVDTFYTEVINFYEADNMLADIDIVKGYFSDRNYDISETTGCRDKNGIIIVPCEYRAIRKHPHWIDAVTGTGKHHIYSPEGKLYFKY